jgi:hypothetical protein
MFLDILMTAGVLFLGGVLVVAVGAMLIAAIDFLQNGDDRN